LLAGMAYRSLPSGPFFGPASFIFPRAALDAILVGSCGHLGLHNGGLIVVGIIVGQGGRLLDGRLGAGLLQPLQYLHPLGRGGLWALFGGYWCVGHGWPSLLFIESAVY